MFKSKDSNLPGTHGLDRIFSQKALQQFHEKENVNAKKRTRSPTHQLEGVVAPTLNDFQTERAKASGRPSTIADQPTTPSQAPLSNGLAKIEYTNAAHFPIHQLSYSAQETNLIVQFVDFTSKYGVGYRLSNGSYGVLFNDSTRIVLDPNCL